MSELTQVILMEDVLFSLSLAAALLSGTWLLTLSLQAASSTNDT